MLNFMLIGVFYMYDKKILAYSPNTFRFSGRMSAKMQMAYSESTLYK